MRMGPRLSKNEGELERENPSRTQTEPVGSRVSEAMESGFGRSIEDGVYTNERGYAMA